MTPEQISAIAGVILSLAFEFIPGLSDWYNAQEDTSQRLIMLLALLFTVAGAFGLSCAGQLDTFTCDAAGGWDALAAFVAALVANQATYLITPKRG